MGTELPVRDWIGTGISLLGFVVLAVAFVRALRARSSSTSGPGTARTKPVLRHPIFEFCCGLIVLEAGQLVRAHGWFWAVLHTIVIALVVAGALLIRRDLRDARRQGRR